MFKAKMFNKRASQNEFKTNEVINCLNIKDGNCIADLGSGGCYFSFLFSNLVGEKGKVYALDINIDLLKYIDNQIKEKRIKNIETKLITEKEINLPENSCDLLFIRNVYHHISNPTKYFVNIKKILKENGKIAIIDYKKNKKINFVNLMKHFVEEKDIINDLSQSGYKLIKSFDFLYSQSFNIFEIN